jgi:hypothetical protein
MNRMRISGRGWLARSKAKRILLAALAGAVLIATAGFRAKPAGDDDSQGDSKASRAAIERFWQAYHGNDYGAIP